MTLKEFIMSCSDVNKDSIAKTSFYLTFVQKNVDTGEETVINEITFGTVCNLYKSLKEFQVDLVFPDNTDDILNQLVDAVNVFRSPSNSIEDESKFVPFINLVIVPDEYAGKYYLVCLDAFSINLTSYSTLELPNILRMSFLPGDLVLIEDNEYAATKELETEEELSDEEIDDVFLENPVEQSQLEEYVYTLDEEETKIEEEDDDFY